MSARCHDTDHENQRAKKVSFFTYESTSILTTHSLAEEITYLSTRNTGADLEEDNSGARACGSQINPDEKADEKADENVTIVETGNVK
ncbi:MAG: hypothetical protein Q9157_001165 [Trypethelium eluteriae]